jgi:hypothetical protein
MKKPYMDLGCWGGALKSKILIRFSLPLQKSGFFHIIYLKIVFLREKFMFRRLSG